MTQDIAQIILGASSCAFIVAGLFFFRFWKQTRDRFFLLFSLAMYAYGVSRGSLALMDPANEDRIWLHVLRLAATVLILIAIVEKNLGKRGPDEDEPRDGVTP
ncbi:MAG: hypothetical protein IRZ16_22370 [Myxococcaceae bacterium]|nr:hypothetical protein [Myxococcaceae bacterium]